MNSIGPVGPAVLSCRMNIWQALESSRGLTAVAASWRERLGDPFDPFKDAFLQRAPGIPKGMPCPRGCACTHEIVTSDECRVASDERKSADGHSPPETSVSPIENRKSVFPLYPLHFSPIRALCRCDPPNCPDILLSPDDIVLLE